MKSQISFRTSLFDSKALNTPVSVDRHYGEDLAQWMSKKAVGGEFEFGKPFQSTRGWSDRVTVDGEHFLLGFGLGAKSLDADYAEWIITIEKPKRFGVFGSKDSASRGRLCDLIHNVLRDERGVREVQWSE